MIRLLGRLGIVWTILLVGNSAAVRQTPSPIDLTALSLEDLMNIEVTLASSLFAGDAGQTSRTPSREAPFLDLLDQDTRLTGGNVLAHWQRDFSPSSDLRLQFFYDRNRRDDLELLPISLFMRVVDVGIRIDGLHIFFPFTGL